MGNCININHSEFKSLVERSGLNSIVLASKMGVWMEKNKTDEWPNLEQLGIETKSQATIRIDFNEKSKKTFKSNLFNSILYKFNTSEFKFSNIFNELKGVLNRRDEYLLDLIQATSGRDVKIKLVSSVDKIKLFKDNQSAKAIYDSKTDTIYIDKFLYENNEFNRTNSEFSKMLLHELIHSNTVFRLKEIELKAKNGDVESINKLNEITDIFNRAKLELEKDYSYYFEDIYEFFAGLSDDKFVSELNIIKYENSSIINKVLDFVLRLLGLNKNSLAYQSFKNLFELSTKNTAAKSNNNFDMAAFALSGDISNLHESTKKIIDDGSDFSVEMVTDENGVLNQGEHYINNSTGSMYNRITYGAKSLIEAFLPYRKNKSDDYVVAKANKIWGTLDHSFSMAINGKSYTYDEYIEFERKISNIGKGRGQIGHKLNELINARSIEDKVRIESEIQEISVKYGIDKDSMGWLLEEISDKSKEFTINKLFVKVYKALGINKFSNNIPEGLRDNVVTEVPVFSDIIKDKDGFGYAGTVDMAVEHQELIFDDNGNEVGKYMSLYDFKTGYSILDGIGSAVLKFGEQNRWISNSSLDMAKLQIALYAVLIKSKNPHQRFSRLQVAMLQNRWEAVKFNPNSIVEVDSFIPMIEAFFKDKKSLEELELPLDLYKQLIDGNENLFNPDHYRHVPFEKSDAQTLIEINNKIAILENQLKQSHIKNNKYEVAKINDERAELLKKKIALENDSETATYLLSQEQDDPTPMIKRKLGNLFDSDNRLIKAFGMARNEAYQRYTNSKDKSLSGIQEKIEKLRDEYKKSRGIVEFVESDYIDMYNALLKRDLIENVGSVERLILEKDDEWEKLSDAQKDFITFYNSKLKEYFTSKDSYLNKTGAYGYNGKPISVLKLTDSDFVYYDGFFPKASPSSLELRKKAGGGSTIAGTFNKDYLKKLTAKLIDFSDEGIFENYENINNGLPIKYLGNNDINVSEYYSHDLGLSLVKFIDWIEYKKEMDTIYSMGKSIVNTIRDKANAEQNEEIKKDFENEIEILSGFLKIEIQGIRRLKEKFFGDKGIRIGNATNPITNKPLYFAPQKFLDGLSNWARSTSIWLNPRSGAGNTVTQGWLVYRNAIKDDISKWFIGDVNYQTDMDVKSFAFANKEFAKMVSDMLAGKLYSNKTWLLMEKHNYINGNTLNAVRRVSSTFRERTTLSEAMMAFQSASEFYTLSASYLTQMNHMKLKDGRTFYEAYDIDEDNNVVWNGGIRGKLMLSDGTYKDLGELDSMEIKRLHRVHEKLFGSYRSDEFTGLEIYAFGRFFMTLKKYFQRVVLNLFDPSKNDWFLGEYKAIGTTLEGDRQYDIYSWKGREIEAKIHGILRLLAVPYYFSTQKGKNSFKMLSPEQKRNMLEAAQTYFNLVVMVALYSFMFGDIPDEDARKKWWRMYMIDNVAQQYNPIDITRTLSNLTPMGFSRAFKTGEALVATGSSILNVTFSDGQDAYTQEGNLKGFVNLQRCIPFLSSYYEIIRNVQSMQATNGEEKTRNIFLDWVSNDPTIALR